MGSWLKWKSRWKILSEKKIPIDFFDYTLQIRDKTELF